MYNEFMSNLSSIFCRVQ